MTGDQQMIVLVTFMVCLTILEAIRRVTRAATNIDEATDKRRQDNDDQKDK